MEKQDLEKAKIIFNEAKAMLQSSRTNSEQLEQKVSRFVTVCVTSIGCLTAVLSFLKEGNFFFKIGLLILISGFIHSLFKILQSSKTNKFASDGLEASTIIDDEECKKEDASYLMTKLALTYEEKANHNNQVSGKIGELFDKVLKNLEKYLLASSISMLIGFFIL
jgi:hypothetical protein